MTKLSMGWVLTGVLGLVADAAAITVQCDRCTQQDMETIANDRLVEMSQLGPLYVVDVRGGVIRRYDYATNGEPGMNPEIGGFNMWAQEAPVESQFVTGVQEAAVMAGDVPETVVVNPNRPDLPSDSHDALGRTDMDSAIDAYIKTMASSHMTNRLAGYLRRFAGGSYFDPQALFVEIVLIYQDGSRATYRYNPESGVYERKTDSSRDSSRNKIPEQRAQAAGITYRFPNSAVGDTRAQDDFYDMWRRLEALGVPIVDRSGAQSGYTHVLVCVDGECYIQILPL